MPARWSVMERASLTKAGNPAAAGPGKPGVQQRDRAGALELEHQPQLLLEQIGLVEVLVDLCDAGELAALAHGQVLGVLPQREPGTLELAGQRRLPAPPCGVPGLAADLVQRIGRPPHDVKGVQAQHDCRAAAGDRVGDPGGRIRAHMGELAGAIGSEGIKEAFQGLLIVAGRGPHQPAGVVVDHHGQVAMALAVGDLVDADAPQPSRRSMSWPASSATRVTIRPAVRQATPAARRPPPGRWHGQPRRGVLKRPGEPRSMPRPRHRGDHHPMGRATNPGRVGLQEHPHHAKVQPTPAAPALALVIARAAALTDRTAPPAAAGGPHHGDHRVSVLVEDDLLDHGVLDTQQPLPYPCRSHAVPPPGNPALSSRKPNDGAACSHARAAQTTHGSVTRAPFLPLRPLTFWVHLPPRTKGP
jgi:hypothetical protein